MSQEPLVSIITPSFNCGKYIHRLLNSILMQTYSNIEVFVCDDGSTDNTENVLQEFVEKFKIRGFKFKYIKQKNSGQSGAINYLLKQITGQYLVWPDADDFYASSKAIEKMVNALSKTDNTISMVHTFFSYVSEQNLHVEKQEQYETIENWFEACLFGTHGFHFCPGKYMVKVGILDQVIPGREIYTEYDAGQNWQLMLPLLYRRKCIVIKEPLYNVLVRTNSHSRSKKSIEKAISRIGTYENTISATLDSMFELSEVERIQYKKRVKEKYIKEKYYTSFYYLNKKYLKYFYLQLLDIDNKNIVSLKDKMIYYFPHLFWFLQRLHVTVRRKLHA